MGRKSLTDEQFITKSKLIHGNKYDYSLVDYKNNSTKIKIICPNHGYFYQIPNNHLNGKGCIKCFIDKVKLTDEQFIMKSKLVHGNKYDYSLVDYKNNFTKVKIIHPIYGIFEQTPHNHMCGKHFFKNKKMTNEQFISNAELIRGDKYDYSLVDYKNNHSKIDIICSIHGVFKQSPSNHISKLQGCPICKGNKKLTNNQFISKSKLVHGNKYDYSLIDYKNMDTNVIIICPKHQEFKQIPYHHTNGSGCPICKESKGEKEIRKELDNNNILYEYQKTFKDCKLKRKLPFDFYLPKLNTCIEYDGIQHFEPIDYFGGDDGLKNTKLRDNIKNDYCKNNVIKLIRIKYNDKIKDKIRELISN